MAPEVVGYLERDLARGKRQGEILLRYTMECASKHGKLEGAGLALLEENTKRAEFKQSGTRTRTHARTHAQTHTYIHVYLHAHTHTHTQTHTHLHTPQHAHSHTYAHTTDDPETNTHALRA